MGELQGVNVFSILIISHDLELGDSFKRPGRDAVPTRHGWGLT